MNRAREGSTAGWLKSQTHSSDHALTVRIPGRNSSTRAPQGIRKWGPQDCGTPWDMEPGAIGSGRHSPFPQHGRGVPAPGAPFSEHLFPSPLSPHGSFLPPPCAVSPPNGSGLLGLLLAPASLCALTHPPCLPPRCDVPGSLCSSKFFPWCPRKKFRWLHLCFPASWMSGNPGI